MNPRKANDDKIARAFAVLLAMNVQPLRSQADIIKDRFYTR